MRFMELIYLKNDFGTRRAIPTGFSWTMLFFGSWVPLLRRDYKWFIISMLCIPLTLGFSRLVFPFIYNHLHLRDLLNQGYYIID